MPLPTRIPRVSRSLAREHIHSHLESWIVEGSLRPEEVLSDKEIASAFGVSRMPVREALRSLEDRGFIETALNRWTRVSPLRPEKAQHLYQIVSTLEEAAMRAAFPRFTTAEFARLKLALSDLEDAITLGNAVKATRADGAFHSVWIERADNPELEQIVSECRTKLMRIELAFFECAVDMQRSCSEHLRILSALERKDLAAAVSELSSHWSSSIERCLARMPSPDRGEQR